MANVVNVNLAGVTSQEGIMQTIGQVLQLGGPNGNHKVGPDAEVAGWGMNWSALRDSLCYLDVGGIWGSSPKIGFPLTLRFVNHAQLKHAAPDHFATLVSILEDVQTTYARTGLSFTFEFAT